MFDQVLDLSQQLPQRDLGFSSQASVAFDCNIIQEI